MLPTVSLTALCTALLMRMILQIIKWQLSSTAADLILEVCVTVETKVDGESISLILQCQRMEEPVKNVKLLLQPFA